MSNWARKRIDLGTIIEKTKSTVYFRTVKDIPEIKEIRSSCGCVITDYNETSKLLKVDYSSKKVPYRL